MRKLLWLLPLLIAAPALAQPAPQQVCVPASQAQSLLSYLSQAQALQLQMLEAAHAPERDAEIVKRAKAEQKAEDEKKPDQAPPAH